MNGRVLKFFAILTFHLTVIQLVTGDDPIKPEEKQALKKFLPMVRNIVPRDYMKTEAFLIRWLRVKNLDLVSAKEMLTENLKWRIDNDIDNLVYDNKSLLAKTFLTILPGVDKKGRPYYIQDWSGDFRKATLGGRQRQEELSEYLGSVFEHTDRKARALNVHNNNTEFIGIYDLNKFSASTHLCPTCLPVYIEHANRYEHNYPRSAKAFYMINTPAIFDRVLQLVAPVLGDTVNRFRIMGRDKVEWKAALLKIIPADQLPVKYGGKMLSTN